MKKLIFILIAAIAISCNSNNKIKEQEADFLGEENHSLMSQLPEAPRWILDNENIFNADELNQLQSIADSMFSTTGNMCMIQTIETYKPFNSLNEYAQAIDANWHDDSQKYIIIILSTSLVEVRIINGDMLEKAIPNSFTDYVIQQVMIPEFSNNNYFEGIKKTINLYIETLSKSRQ